jgi:hypothetical protein
MHDDTSGRHGEDLCDVWRLEDFARASAMLFDQRGYGSASLGAWSLLESSWPERTLHSAASANNGAS